VGKTQQRYFDVFRLSFFLIGINLVDLCHLPTTAIQDGRLVYVRRKTHKLYSIRIEKEAAEIMKRYVKGGSFLLQFYNGENYRAFGQHLNDNLPDGTTLYWARHSWATVAASLDIPDDVISLALGHSAKNPTTDIYIRRDLKKVDEANRKVIDYVLHGKM
jgi:integrase